MKKNIIASFILSIVLMLSGVLFVQAIVLYRCPGSPPGSTLYGSQQVCNSNCTTGRCVPDTTGSTGAGRYTSQNNYPNVVVPGGNSPIQSVEEGMEVFVAIVEWAQVLFWILAVGFGLYAAYLYLTSSGEPDKVKKAGKQLIYTVVAIALALLALSLPAIISDFLYG